MIFKYDDFIFENIISESILYLAPSLEKVLSKINSNISKDLLSVVGTDIKPDITFLDIDEDDYIKFSTMRNFKKSIVDNFPTSIPAHSLDTKYLPTLLNNLKELPSSYEDNVNSVNTRARNKVKIGRLINQVFPGKYTGKELEEFVNKFKSLVSGDGSGFEIVSGDDIEYWYDSSRYSSAKGSLGGSCMAGKKGIFDLYTKNSNCRLLILKEDEDTITGRALVWKLDYLKVDGEKYEDIFFLDRQYTNDESDVYKFRDYANENGWVIKARNSHSSFGPIIFKGVEHSGSEMCVTSPPNLSRFPYVDTFKLYDPETGKMRNEDPDECDKSEFSGFYDLSDTGGGYSVLDDDDVWSDYYSENINREYAVWSDHHDSYLNSENSINIGDDWYSEDSNAICYSNHSDEWYLRDDCVWSDIYDTYIKEDDSVECIISIELDGKVDTDWIDSSDSDIIDIKHISKECLNMLTKKGRLDDDYKYIINTIVTGISDSPGATDYEVAFDLFAIDVYKVKLDIENSDIEIFLPKGIAKSLELEIDLDNHYTTDCFLLSKDIIVKEKSVTLFRSEPIVSLNKIVELDYYSYSEDERFIDVAKKYYVK